VYDRAALLAGAYTRRTEEIFEFPLSGINNYDANWKSPQNFSKLNAEIPNVGFVKGLCVKKLDIQDGELFAAHDPEQQFQRLSDTLAKHFSLAHSEKHMVGKDLGRLEPTPALNYKAAA
jgi:hypothetical protein